LGSSSKSSSWEALLLEDITDIRSIFDDRGMEVAEAIHKCFRATVIIEHCQCLPDLLCHVSNQSIFAHSLRVCYKEQSLGNTDIHHFELCAQDLGKEGMKDISTCRMI
jgi:hypothetical protein